MTTIAVAMVKDEADIVERVVRHMLDQVDGVLVADNGSSDGTREILDALPVEVIADPAAGYYQSAKMTRLARRAAELGADWVVPFDADEWWYSPFGRIADVLAGQPQALVATAAVYDHVATAADPDGDPIARIGWRRVEAAPLPKVACRPVPRVTIAQGNHEAIYPTSTVPDLLVVRHFPYRSAEQFIRKARNGAAAYAATDLPTELGAHWRGYGQILADQGEEACADIFRTWFWSAAPEQDPSLIFDPAP